MLPLAAMSQECIGLALNVKQVRHKKTIQVSELFWAPRRVSALRGGKTTKIKSHSAVTLWPDVTHAGTP